MTKYLFILFFFIMAGKANAKEKDFVGAIAWMQNSAEYQASLIQTFKLAALTLPTAKQDLNWTAALEQFENPEMSSLPAAVILDLDDTIISSMPYRAELYDGNDSHNRKLWEKWIAFEKAPILPGVLDFIKKTSSLKIKIIIVSNRICQPTRQDQCPIKTKTQAMLRKVGLVFNEEQLLFRNERPDWQQDKGTRRQYIAENYRVLMIIGDDLQDMIANVAKTPARSRLLYTEQYKKMWGERWFILPNPVYGTWRQVAGKKISSVLKDYR